MHVVARDRGMTKTERPRSTAECNILADKADRPGRHLQAWVRIATAAGAGTPLEKQIRLAPRVRRRPG
jgi:hypothetical protein